MSNCNGKIGEIPINYITGHNYLPRLKTFTEMRKRNKNKNL